MRITPDDPRARYASILLDGENVRYCVEADSDEGWADAIAVDERGDAIVEGDDVKIERKHGEVVITFSPECPGALGILFMPLPLAKEGL